jgi:hypothetical protein
LPSVIGRRVHPVRDDGELVMHPQRNYPGTLTTAPSRLVLSPQGPPLQPNVESGCMDVILRCGGDLQRIIDSPTPTLEIFANHLRRLRALDADDPPLVILHQTNPVVIAIIGTRRELQRRVPRLHGAAWIILHDREADPFFEQEALDLGSFDDPTLDAPIWSSPGGLHFLVARPGLNCNLDARVRKLLSCTTVPPSGRTGQAPG